MTKPRKLAIFGSTGSIGTQTLDVVDRTGEFEVVYLSAGQNWQLLAEQVRKYHPVAVGLSNGDHIDDFYKAVGVNPPEILIEDEALTGAAREVDYNICVNGLVGVVGLKPSYYALKRGIDLATANKESLVLGGDLLNAVASETKAQILPIDSEHGAIWQCLRGERMQDVKRLILTASGGPFRLWDLDKIANATVEEALNHPTWKMGAKITIDSATLMNKGLEVIEAYHLFHVPPEKIAVRVHPVSIVHSMVEFVDGSFKAQLGKPDMRIPIQYALTYPTHKPLDIHQDDPLDWPPLEFLPVDYERYPCLQLAFNALSTGGTAPAVLNGADEQAVELFLAGKIKFGEISRLIGECLNDTPIHPADDLNVILAADQWGRDKVLELI